ncbi:hypothetical protein BHU72_12970 [Desulfuribacillus stibiiarsenatis]|uniref:Regulatory protein YycH-like domain-containing protein n=1 Tax=Desulfuribacillus stibiiarsenatis TaxID=1390249 RepID=A0A1E5L8Y0_9FIRM|nr:two-component system regulatory protein YycI [Desulfuribacillus stibiiarsenatis]OEH86518.1 hypothetical protein BHU72_12970 [Desulfuribacillus stibiiarsenatis]
MDLGKAKTILIVAFLFLNGLLAYQLYLKFASDQDYLNILQEEVNEVEELLAKHRININVPIPLDATDMAHLKVLRELYYVEDVMDKIDPIIQLHVTMDVNTFQGIHYTWNRETNNQAEAYDISMGYKEFLDNYVVNGYKYELQKEDIVNGNGEVIFVQYYGRHPIYGTTIIATVENNKIIEWYQQMITNVSFEPQKRPILAAATALRKLVTIIGNSKAVIEKVELGYYSRSIDTETWLLPPVWYIELKDGQRFYINAFTGELEGLQAQANVGEDQ